MPEPLLKISGLTVSVEDDGRRKNILSALDLEIAPLKIVGLVGGSGSGKTTVGLSVLRLLAPALSVQEGAILFKGENILNHSLEKMRALRGKEISMVFQEPLDAFNPVFTIGYQIEEVLKFHTQLSGGQIRQKVLDLLDLVEIPEPARVAREYPHRLSGGMRQRAMIAQAIALNPRLLIADEPTSNLDVTIQARIMELFRRLRKELNIAMLVITHDLGLVQHLADEVAVMSDGAVVEYGQTTNVLNNPQHAYTQKLMETLK